MTISLGILITIVSTTTGALTSYYTDQIKTSEAINNLSDRIDVRMAADEEQIGATQQAIKDIQLNEEDINRNVRIILAKTNN